MLASGSAVPAGQKYWAGQITSSVTSLIPAVWWGGSVTDGELRNRRTDRQTDRQTDQQTDSNGLEPDWIRKHYVTKLSQFWITLSLNDTCTEKWEKPDRSIAEGSPAEFHYPGGRCDPEYTDHPSHRQGVWHWSLHLGSSTLPHTPLE